MKPNFKMAVIGIVLLLLIGKGLELSNRIKALELACHGQCHYGDTECAKRCQAARHCEYAGGADAN